jgi:fatty-acyl-CoA synthase
MVSLMTVWNFAEAWEVVAEVVPDHPAQEQGDRILTWRQFDQRANALAADLLDAGLAHQAKVAVYLYNGPEYLETYDAAFKAGLVPVNTNYRYGPEELAYLLDNADAEAVVFDVSFQTVLEQIRHRLSKVRRWYAVGDSGEVPPWAVDYERVVGVEVGRVEGPWGRSSDDLLLLYTGGTTGVPKGVMWRQEDLWMVLGGGSNPMLGVPPARDMGEYRDRIEAAAANPPLNLLPACPLMHGTGQFTAFINMNGAGCIVTMADRSFDPVRLWQTVQDGHINAVTIVGDAFARPMLAALDANPGRWDLASVLVITSSGVMWSREVKAGLAKHLPGTIMYDSLGSSEAVGMAASTSGGGASTDTATFTLNPDARVFTDDNRSVVAGSGEIGMVAIPGYVPIGYYKDPEKSARTFRVVDGVRYSMPGDYATVEVDGTIRLLGRGSVVINTGGEKVFPEEVEEALKLHPAIADAVAVGLPDERFGEIVCAVVELKPGARPIQPDEVIDFVRARLARYKAPRAVITVPSIGRSPAGKVDYRGLRQLAEQQTGG